jgi:hypothetical protein
MSDIIKVATVFNSVEGDSKYMADYDFDKNGTGMVRPDGIII